MTDSVLGKDSITSKDVTIALKHRLTGMYVIGANGTGKSTLLEHLIVQDIEAGMGVCLLDPHGDLTNAVLNRIPQQRINDVILLNPLEVDFPFGLNLFTCSDTNDPEKVELAVEQIVQIYEKVFKMSLAETPRLSQFVRHIAYTLVGTEYTMCEIPLLFLDKAFRERMVAHVSSSSTRLFWRSYDQLRSQEQLDRSESTLDRIDSLISNSIIRNIVGQSRTTIDFRGIMDTGKILLVSLSARYESLTSLIGSIIIGQLLTASLSRAGGSKRRQFNLYADEYQRFATPDFATLLTEARKFGVATTIAHQVRTQLDEKNAATALQAGSLVCFRVTSEDAEELAPSFNLTPKAGDPIERPVRSPAQNVIETLINRGSHEEPRVNEFVQKYLRPLSQAANDKIDFRRDLIIKTGENEIYPRKSYPEGSYAYNPKLIKEELNILNTVLFQAMTGGNTCKPDYVHQWSIFAQYLGCSHFMHHKDVKNLRSWDSMMVLNLINQLLETNKQSPSDIVLDLMGQLKAPLYYANFDPYEEEGFPLELTYFYTSLPVTVDINDLYRVAKQIIAAERIRMEAYFTCFDGVFDGLKKSPIMVDSGKYEKTEGPRQTYSDRANEIANELVQLKRGHARVKLPTGEFHLTTIVPATSHKDFATKKEKIVDNTRRNYCKPRIDVEEEIRRRQESGSPMPTTRKHPL